MADANARDERRHLAGPEDSRTPAQRDRDRVLYSTAFRRLAGVTQVVGPLEGHIFHNRLTHTVEVAQVARRLAERLLVNQSELADSLGGVDPDVVEAAALIHDLGHPPFGHIAEVDLNHRVIESGDDDGFEGNPQSFRIVTHLAAHRKEHRGLNLTRATLNAVLKYPYSRKRVKPKDVEKFGSYKLDKDDFVFARAGSDGERKSVEAQIMDHADALTYSVHDLDDFYRAGLIPISRIADLRTGEFDHFLDEWKRDPQIRGVTPAEVDAYRDMMLGWVESNYIGIPFAPSWRQAAELRTATSGQIAEFVTSVKLQPPDQGGNCLDIPKERQILIRFCQRLVWHYVIANPRLATQQRGETRIIGTLFTEYHAAIRERRVDLVPPRFRDDVDGAVESNMTGRLAADIVSSFSDAQAIQLYGRLTGTSIGSVTSLL